MNLRPVSPENAKFLKSLAKTAPHLTPTERRAISPTPPPNEKAEQLARDGHTAFQIAAACEGLSIKEAEAYAAKYGVKRR